MIALVKAAEANVIQSLKQNISNMHNRNSPPEKCTFSSTEAASADPRCVLALEQGTCRQYKIHWYYDKQANSCAQFWYGGCGGNDNRFKTEEECKKTCVINRRGKQHTSNNFTKFVFSL